MHRNLNQRNRSNRNFGGDAFNNKNIGLLGEPPGMSMNRNKQSPGVGLGLLGSGPDQSLGNAGAGMGHGLRTGAGMSNFGPGVMGNAGMNQQSFGNARGNNFGSNMGGGSGNNFASGLGGGSGNSFASGLGGGSGNNFASGLGGGSGNNFASGLGGDSGHNFAGNIGGGGRMNQGLNENMNRNIMGGTRQQMSVMQDSQIAAMRDSQLQLVSNLIQQQGTMSSGGSGLMGAGLTGGGGGLQSGMPSGLLGSGGSGLLEGPAQGMSSVGTAGILGVPGGMGGPTGIGGARGPTGGRMGNIPSIFDISTNKGRLLGKRMNNQRDNYNNNQNKRMRQNQNQVRGQQQNRQYQNRRNDRNDRRSPNRSGRPKEREFRSRSSSSKYSDPSPSSRSSRDRRESESSLPSRKEEGEEYDPAEPTEEEEEFANVEMSERSLLDDGAGDEGQSMEEGAEMLQKTEGQKNASEAQEGDSNLTVTVLDDSGRSVNDTQQKKDLGSPGGAKKTNFYCHACGTECRSEQGFSNHMNGKKHKLRMESLLALHQHKSEQLVARMKAEEHLRKVEGKPRQRRISEGGRSSDGGMEDDRSLIRSSGKQSRFNKGLADQSWGGPPSGRYRQPLAANWRSSRPEGTRHGQARSGQAQKRSFDTWPRCNVCDQMFKSPQKYIKHLKTPHHMEIVRERNRRSRQDKDYDDDDDGFPDLGDLVTLDTIGFEDDLDDEMDIMEELDAGNNSDKPKNASPITIPDYDPDVPLGQKYVIPVSGFFCKLCHRFYNSENAAKITHCQSKSHYDKFQKVMLAKILNKQFKDDSDKKEENVNSQSETQELGNDQSETQELGNDQSETQELGNNQSQTQELSNDQSKTLEFSKSESSPKTTNEHVKEEPKPDISQPETEDGNSEECNGEDIATLDDEIKEQNKSSQEEAMEEDLLLADTPEVSPTKPAKDMGRGRARRGRRGRVTN